MKTPQNTPRFNRLKDLHFCRLRRAVAFGSGNTGIGSDVIRGRGYPARFQVSENGASAASGSR